MKIGFVENSKIIDAQFCLLIILLPLVCYTLHICYTAYTMVDLLFLEKHITASSSIS